MESGQNSMPPDRQQFCSGLDFFKIPQELRPNGLVIQAQLRERHHGLLQQARQLIEAVETDIIKSMVPNDSGVATSKLHFLYRGEGLYLQVETVFAPGQPEHELDLWDALELDPWFSNVFKRAAEGCGFKTLVERVQNGWDDSFCTCLSLSLEIPGATTSSV